MIANNPVVVWRVINRGDGNRLVLYFVDIEPPTTNPISLPGVPVLKSDEQFFDFHSLVWDVADGTDWIRKATITEEDLQLGSLQRWVSDIHSLNPATGSAIIKIAEGEAVVTYSWREWDLCGNKQLRLIKMCNRPFDGLDDSANSV